MKYPGRSSSGGHPVCKSDATKPELNRWCLLHRPEIRRGVLKVVVFM